MSDPLWRGVHPMSQILFQVNCDLCRRDITRHIRIKCAECKDVDLCLPCFSTGAEFLDHQNDHAYQLFGQVREPIFTEGWGADEELRLLEGIARSGIDNWDIVARHVATGKTARQCQAHYEAIYLTRAGHLQGDGALVKQDEEESMRMASRSADEAPTPFTQQYKLRKPSRGNAALLGYTHRRQELAFPFDPEAESAISYLEFDCDPDGHPDPSYVTETKIRLLRRYTEAQDRRHARLQFLRSRGFLLDPDDPEEDVDILLQWGLDDGTEDHLEQGKLSGRQPRNSSSSASPPPMPALETVKNGTVGGKRRSRSSQDLDYVQQRKRRRMRDLAKQKAQVDATLAPLTFKKLRSLFPYHRALFYQLMWWMKSEVWRRMVGHDPDFEALQDVTSSSSPSTGGKATQEPEEDDSVKPTPEMNGSNLQDEPDEEEPPDNDEEEDELENWEPQPTHEWTPEAIIHLILQTQRIDRFSACPRQHLQFIKATMVEEYLRVRIAELQARRACSGLHPSAADERTVLDLEGVEHLSAEERRLCLELDIAPPHYTFIKSRLLVQAAADGGILRSEKAHSLFADQINYEDPEYLTSIGLVVPARGKEEPAPRLTADERGKITPKVLESIYKHCIRMGWFLS